MILPISVIIVQLSGRARNEFRRGILDARFLEEEFLLTGNLDRARGAISPGEKQLLVTGPFDGNEKAARDFVRRMKSRNPDLQAASFTVYPVENPYDFFVQKEVGRSFSHGLVVLMENFRVHSL